MIQPPPRETDMQRGRDCTGIRETGRTIRDTFDIEPSGQIIRTRDLSPIRRSFTPGLIPRPKFSRRQESNRHRGCRHPEFNRLPKFNCHPEFNCRPGLSPSQPEDYFPAGSPPKGY